MRLLMGLAAAALVFCAEDGTARATSEKPAPAGLPMPRFSYETQWLKLPDNLALGEITAVAVDRRDHLWVLHRPRTVTGRDPAGVAAPIVEFDADGRYLRSFGGPGPGYEWPDKEHSLAVAANGDVWISGNLPGQAPGDDMLIAFDAAGRFVRQIGRRNASQGNYDQRNFRSPADIYVDERAHELYVADGYGNQRIVVLGAKDGRFRRMWGAFGAAPPAAALSADARTDGESQSFNGLHGVEMSRDGLVYVSDRMNQRIQVFTRAGKFLRQAIVGRGQKSASTVSGITFSRDPAQKYLFVADWGNSKIAVLDRRKMTVLGVIGQEGVRPGEFRGPHLIDTDSKGRIYVAEVQGRRLQRLTPAPSPR
jgi:hypothetical protein